MDGSVSVHTYYDSCYAIYNKSVKRSCFSGEHFTIFKKHISLKNADFIRKDLHYNMSEMFRASTAE